MMKRILILVISLFLLTTSSVKIPQPTPTLSNPTAVAVCHRPFRDAIDWTGVIWPRSESEDWDWEEMMSIIIPQTIEAGEVFLNSCVDPAHPLLEQTKRLDDMAELATLICPSDALPPGWQEQSYSARVQLVNLDNDDSSELLLITRALNTSYGGDFRVVYDLNENTETWQGTLVWPTSLDDYSSNEPSIRPLSIAGTEDQTLVLIEGDFWGADHTAKHIWVWQWKDNHLEVMLKIRLSDWCGPEWHNWEVTEQGILVYATKSTDRCEAREAILYYLEDGEFTSKTP
jgi:hypothetical protein